MSTINPGTESCVIINQASPHFSQAKTNEGQQSPAGSTHVPKHIATFYKGQPEALGATQIFLGVLFIAFGISLTMTCTHYCRYMDFLIFSGVMFWPAIAHIIAGSLSAAAAVKPTLGLVRSSLVVNVISSIFGSIAIILVSLSFATYYPYREQLCSIYPWRSKCDGEFNPLVFSFGILGILISFSVLVFCISISAAVFGCRTACRSSFQEVTVVIYQTAPPTTSVPETSDGISDIHERVHY